MDIRSAPPKFHESWFEIGENQMMMMRQILLLIALLLLTLANAAAPPYSNTMLNVHMVSHTHDDVCFKIFKPKNWILNQLITYFINLIKLS